MLLCWTRVLFMVFSPKKICLAQVIVNGMFIYSSLWVNSQNKVCTSSYRHKSLLCMMLLLCGDIKSLPGPIRHDIQQDSLLTCRGLKLFN